MFDHRWQGGGAILADLTDFSREMERVFGGLGAKARVNGGVPFARARARVERQAIPVSLFETPDAFVVVAQAPGLDRESLDVTVQGTTLSLRGRRIAAPTTGEALRRERRPDGEVARIVELPGRVEADAVEATYRDGLLFVRLPKAAEIKPRRVTIGG